MRKTFTIGIDPGFGRTGVVVLNEDNKVVNYATFSSNYPSAETHHRVEALAEEVAVFLMGYPSDKCVISIERPVYNKNASAFEKQWRFFQGLLTRLAPVMPEALCCEVDNGTAKKALTGNGKADKLEMVACSEFAIPGMKDKDSEALADAQGIALAAVTPQGYRRQYPIAVHIRAADTNVVKGG